MTTPSLKRLTKTLVAFAAVTFLESALAAERCDHTDSSFSCVKFLKNYDGDTVTVDIPGVPALFGRAISVRIRGIDTPEMRGRGPCEREAARAARDLVTTALARAKRVDLKNVGRDKYFRILADVETDGVSLSRLLIERGLAVSYDGGTKRRSTWCPAPKSL